ncbi:hypothetical protein NIES4071_14130 [Calothrix sp. NIES-4071]|nr:hypothetical protein NIES4071_14130 [Calothrix sp. NIES-4071]BAZ55751.1 hypothetical protein NIES4105_14080 [Calothrix sp. NIES-4105]
MNQIELYRIKPFFDWWRRKQAFINSLDLSEQRYEANALLYTSLDALSNHWAKSIRKGKYDKSGKRIIFNAFLASYGGDIFKLVSLPDVWHRVTQGEVSKLPMDVSVFLRAIGGCKATSALYEYEDDLDMDAYTTRSISDDLSLDDIVNQTLTSSPNAIQSQLEEWLVYSQYGAIVYKQLRNAYIHEGQPGKRTHDFKLCDWEEKPTYRSSVYGTPPVMGFSVEFMLGVLKQCIDEFEAEALKLQIDPAPSK